MLDNYNVTAVSIAIVLGGILFTFLIWRSVEVSTQRYAERFNTCVQAGGMWIPVRGDNEAVCLRP